MTFKPLSEGEQKGVRQLLGALEAFFSLRETMPAQYIRAFLLVAEKEGLGVVDYARRAGVSMSVMSRHLLDIGERNRHMEPGFGLVIKRQDPMNLRRWEVLLTEKGRQVARKMMRSLRVAV